MTQGVGVKVLVVDDERGIADGLGAILDRIGHPATVAYSLAEAAKAAQQMVPDVLISDCFLQDGTGIELAISLFASAVRPQVLLLSGCPEDAKQLLAQNHLTDQVRLLEKPVPIEDVLEVLRTFQEAA